MTTQQESHCEKLLLPEIRGWGYLEKVDTYETPYIFINYTQVKEAHF